MKLAKHPKDALRFWGLGALALLLCAGAAFSYLFCMSNGIAAGALVGLRGREQDVIIAQRWAGFWFTASVGCLGASSVAAALATPVCDDVSRVAQLIRRAVVAAVVSLVLAVLIGWVIVSIATASHHPVVRRPSAKNLHFTQKPIAPARSLTSDSLHP